MSTRLAHLGMIQGIISRLAGFSANAKNLSITVVAAIAGISYQQRLPILFFAAGIVIVLFAALDIYYLAQERRFRSHYKVVVDRPLTDARKLDLDPAKLTFGQYLAATRSFSTGGFYLLLLIVAGVILPIAYERSDFNGLGNLSSAARLPESERIGQTSNVAPRPRTAGPTSPTSSGASLPNPQLAEPQSASADSVEPVRDSSLNRRSNK